MFVNLINICFDSLIYFTLIKYVQFYDKICAASETLLIKYNLNFPLCTPEKNFTLNERQKEYETAHYSCDSVSLKLPYQKLIMD